MTWSIDVRPDLTITERVCVTGFVPERVAPENHAAARYATVLGAQDGCTTVAIDLVAMARGLDDDAMLDKVGDAVYGSFDPWLWRPEPWPMGLVGRLTLTLPEGLSASLPNERLPGGAYAVPYSTWSFMARFALGRLGTDAFTAAGANVSVARLPGAGPKLTAAGVRRFIGDAASAVATVDGRMPSDRVQVILARGSRSRYDADPVQFGMAMRGAGPAIVLRISPEATDESIWGEWVTVHELAHLWLPPVVREDAWLPEGFASYYQCVFRARAGMQTEAEAWTELVEGFGRGRRSARGTKLKDARFPRFQQIYWGGAAIWLEVDADLRAHGSSLDAVVAEVRRAHPDHGPTMARLDDRPALDVLALLEGRTGRDLRGIARRRLEEPFPDVAALLAGLGIREGASGVTLDDAAPNAAVRKAISGATRKRD